MAMLRHVAGLALRRSATSPGAVVARSFGSPGCSGPTAGLALLQRPAPPPAAAAAAASRFFSNGKSSNTKSALDKRMEETKEALYPRKMHTHDSAAKIRIVMKSFNNQKNNLTGLAPYTQKIGLPESRSLYTVLRSPHIDKKSREQFSMHVKKVFVVKKAETHELAKKFFWLKRMRIMGAQYEIHISFKTRLDKKIGCSKGGGLLRQ
ncbi:40S ribosomal protein S10, mitochondrial [Brachypodium distachyon]|uniref:Small ribosomal subunit protein uS10 domain-containing protein n=1 Tax=Brachypodium distachyon TaxID=15368 RepID=A0A0Q3E6Y7_BRADI|nr:40S ribosomal protein S10, mitochondrial [Brachypodium distachyon]XP_024311697.1 40S ribosomal protein S10, mitochondrial [Brachypodium distachyon]KQJ83631.1 hypothetical protein BRADI_5g15914v3 [Brachypodium distachyon]|eukprot:XP_003581436.1 40S ribosomal protein S10, mitochondrial [Brachypodium distachyon]